MNTVAVRERVGVDSVGLVRRVVDILGGRYSTELGVDVDGGEAEVERWFVAATLFGSRISASVAERTFKVLDGAGLTRIACARDWSWDDLVALLDEGGYARYDFQTGPGCRLSPTSSAAATPAALPLSARRVRRTRRCMTPSMPCRVGDR